MTPDWDPESAESDPDPQGAVVVVLRPVPSATPAVLLLAASQPDALGSVVIMVRVSSGEAGRALRHVDRPLGFVVRRAGPGAFPPALALGVRSEVPVAAVPAWLAAPCAGCRARASSDDSDLFVPASVSAVPPRCPIAAEWDGRDTVFYPMSVRCARAVGGFTVPWTVEAIDADEGAAPVDIFVCGQVGDAEFRRARQSRQGAPVLDERASPTRPTPCCWVGALTAHARSRSGGRPVQLSGPVADLLVSTVA